MAGWSQDKVLEFIALVEERPSLYDTEHPFYKSKNARKHFFEEICTSLAKLGHSITPAEATRKWNVLRSTFVAEKRKVRESTQSGASAAMVYRPTLFYFEAMKFIENSLEQRQSYSSMDPESTFLSSPPSPGVNDVGVDVQFTNGEGEDLCDNIETISVTSPLIRTRSNKRRRESDDENKLSTILQEAVLSLASLQERRKDDHLDLYGQYLVSRLKLLDEDDCLRTQQEIDQIMYNALRNRKK